MDLLSFNKTVTSVFFICIFVWFFSCKVADNLTLEREELTNINLNVDGYYYHTYETGHICFFLYRNGVFYDTQAILNIETLNELDKYLVKRYADNEAIQLHWYWGVYIINKNFIKIEKWLPGTGGAYPTKLIKGEILNDSTIALSGLRGERYKNRVDTFKIRQFRPKPDSTNRFIK